MVLRAATARQCEQAKLASGFRKPLRRSGNQLIVRYLAEIAESGFSSKYKRRAEWYRD